MDILIIAVLIIAAVILFLVELFVIPGISLAGISALVCILYANYYAFTNLGMAGGFVTLGISAVACIGSLIWFMRSKMLDKLALKKDIDSKVDRSAEDSVKVGDIGISTTRLAQIGYAEINGKIVEVKSIDGFLNEKTPTVQSWLRNTKNNIHLIKTSMESSFYLPIFLIAGGIIFLIIFFHYVPFFLWLSAKVSGVNISLIQLFLMRIRNVPPYIIVPGMIEAHKAGLKNITRDELEAHYLAGGHVEKVVHALVSASKANIELPFQMATAIDLAGRDVFEAVQMSVNPKVIDTPPVTAVAKDGIQLIAKARVTVRANIRQLVGGAGEDTILARVGEGIVSSIGSSENHKSVLENPDSISKLVLRKGLDAGTAFEILSIDIADIDIGKNIGAALQIDQANADKNIAQAKAEERRAMAVASEQEMKAKAQEARAKVIEAEAEVPKAMAEAFRSGNLGIMDYYRMKNIEADTSMRENIAKPTTGNAGNQPLSK